MWSTLFLSRWFPFELSFVDFSVTLFLVMVASLSVLDPVCPVFFAFSPLSSEDWQLRDSEAAVYGLMAAVVENSVETDERRLDYQCAAAIHLHRARCCRNPVPVS